MNTIIQSIQEWLLEMMILLLMKIHLSLSSLSDLGSDISIEDNTDYSDTIDSFPFWKCQKEELKSYILYG